VTSSALNAVNEYLMLKALVENAAVTMPAVVASPVGPTTAAQFG